MNVLLVQPTEPQEPVSAVGTLVASTELLAAPWDLLCIRSFLIERSRHTCRLFDARLSQDLESDLAQHLESTPAPRVLAVHTTTLGLGPVSAVIDIAKRKAPDLVVVLFGQHPSQFPESVLDLPRVDFGLAGDPEPILRNLLDCIDTPPRLHRVPGLVFQGRRDFSPYWLDDFRSLVPGEWSGALWSAYETGLAHRICRAEVRLARGNAHAVTDRAFGHAYEPLRMWPFDKIATRLMQAGPHGIQEVFVNDSPGFWDWQRLNDWIEALCRSRNTQPWGLRVLPAALDEDTVKRLAGAGCRRVKILYPSCDAELLQDMGCTALPSETADMVNLLEGHGIKAQVRFWMGGPEEPPGEAQRVLRVLKSVDPRGYALAPYPFRIDSPDYRRLTRAYRAPGLEEWMKWARDPWTHERPLPLWGGAERQEEIRQLCRHVVRRHRRSARLVLRRALEGLRDFSLASLLEHAHRSGAPASRPR